MPIAARYRQFLPKPSPGQLSPGYSPTQDVLANCDSLQQVRTSPVQDTQGGRLFTASTPPIINLSPGLSPTERQQGSPIYEYDLRETALRRGLQGRTWICYNRLNICMCYMHMTCLST